MPTSGTNNNTAPDSFYNLLVKYGLESKVGGATSYDDNDQGYNIAKAPLYFVRSGNVSIYNGYVYGMGILGYSWPSTSALYTSDIATTAYSLLFSTTDVDSSNGPNHRWYAFPLRCLAD